MMKFKTKEDAIKYGQEKLWKYECEMIEVEELENKKVALCCDDRCYEEFVWGEIYSACEYLVKKFSGEDEEVDVDFVSQIRDEVLEHFEKEYGVYFLDAYDEY